jgi:hypothetical protein
MDIASPGRFRAFISLAAIPSTSKATLPAGDEGAGSAEHDVATGVMGSPPPPHAVRKAKPSENAAVILRIQ